MSYRSSTNHVCPTAFPPRHGRREAHSRSRQLRQHVVPSVEPLVVASDRVKVPESISSTPAIEHEQPARLLNWNSSSSAPARPDPRLDAARAALHDRLLAAANFSVVLNPAFARSVGHVVHWLTMAASDLKAAGTVTLTETGKGVRVELLDDTPRPGNPSESCGPSMGEMVERRPR
jgi:hypothetical protein